MNYNIAHIIWMILSPSVVQTPINVLRQLQSKALRQLPSPVAKEISRQYGGWHIFRWVKLWLDGERITRHQGKWVINSFLPPFPGRAYERMFLKTLKTQNPNSLRKLSPVSAFVAVTGQCPLRCQHCSLEGMREGDLTTHQWLSVINQLHDLGVSLIGFTGGEPLLRKDLADLIHAATHGGAETILFTSGQGLNQDRIYEFQKAGLWGLCVSLDAADAETFDTFRKHPGAFKVAIDALKLAKKSGFYTMISAIGTRSFIESKRYQTLHALASKLGVHEFRIVEPMPCGGLRNNDQLLTKNHIDCLRKFHIKTNHRGHGTKVCAFNHIESPELFGCGAGTQHLYIDPQGRVRPCDFTPLSFGNVTQTPLEPIWTRMNKSFGNAPRRHCFIQKHHTLIDEIANGIPLPLNPENSETVCQLAGTEPLSDYFAHILGRKSI